MIQINLRYACMYNQYTNEESTAITHLNPIESEALKYQPEITGNTIEKTAECELVQLKVTEEKERSLKKLSNVLGPEFVTLSGMQPQPKKVHKNYCYN